jgi:DNA mismatch endonuclease (patch repair protein)
VTDTITRERRSENMRRIKAKATTPEVVVRKAVHAMGFRYRLHVPTLPGKPDLVFSRLRKIIEVRGCFWHQHKGCIDSHIPKSRTEYWRPKLASNKKRDKKTEKLLRAARWDVLVLWECELDDAKQLAKRLAAFLTQ